jgi:hypothetical protein
VDGFVVKGIGELRQATIRTCRESVDFRLTSCPQQVFDSLLAGLLSDEAFEWLAKQQIERIR